VAYAVTPALREWYVDGDLDELEYAAMTDAAGDSLRLLAAGLDESPRRVVIAAEVPDPVVLALAGPMDAGSKAMVRLAAAVPVSQIASVHADADEAMPAIRAALPVVAAADAGDDDAQFVVDGVEDHELLWFATQEIADLIRTS
jgi:hypothetical protein